ncbi:hypothetical protein NB600_18315 [Vibrio antiquarius]|uniref:hypothetical protein n=1 Tax=Vibrio TaxID=662 RepID=UPI001CF88FB7|nr:MULTISPECIES: hypothetical protein [Vibrio]MCG6221605.1 hypothetical protein [Vibrio diabolicus]MCR9687754.1 hypothetical protein [Vibrio antiquarius]
MSIPSMTCNHVQVLKAYLATTPHTLEAKPNGQNKYTFPDGLVVNLYDTTGKVVFQGSVATSQFGQQIVQMVNQMNVPTFES